jgi:hypothetical protein
MVKSNYNGDTIWTRKFGNDLNQSGQKLIETLDDGYILTAIDSYSNSLIIKLNENGDFIWSAHLDNHYPKQIMEFDKGFMIWGTKSHVIDGKNEIHSQFISRDGNQVWLQYYGSGTYFQTADIDNDQNILVMGQINRNIIVIKTDRNGEIIWQRIFESEGIAEPVALLPAKDGNYVMLYNYSIVPVLHKQPRLLKFNALGEKIWEMGYFDFTYYDVGATLTPAAGGGFLISGLLNSNVTENTLFILKTDDLGIPEWVKYIVYESDHYIRPSTLQETSDSGFFLAGTNKYNQFTIMKLNKEDLVYESEYSIITATDHVNFNFVYKLYPNPAINHIIVEMTSDYAELSIMDIKGRVVFHEGLTGKIHYIDLGNLKNGFYITRIVSGNKIYTGKFVIARY